MSRNRGSLLKKRLLKESSMVADDFIAVLEEFEIFEEEFSREESGEEDHGGKGHE